MSNPSPNFAALHRLSPSEWIARREESMTRIGTALADGRLTAVDVAERFGMSRSTAYNHLAHMEVLGLAHRTGVRVRNREYWAPGEKPEPAEQPEVECKPQPMPGQTELNMRRDPLVEALFGPARSAA